MALSIDHSNLLARRISSFVGLSPGDRHALDQLWARPRLGINPQHDLVREGEAPRWVRLLTEGWACRYKVLGDGRRQITGFFLPGDICDLNIFVLRAMDHSVLALTPVRTIALCADDFSELTLRHPRILQAFWWESLVNASIQREWTVNLGQRSAIERMAHLLCELFVRLRVIGAAQGTACELPVTQIELADALGLTPVHVSRTLKQLRERGLVRLRGRQLEIPDFDELTRIALFNPTYLHLDREGAEQDAMTIPAE